MINSFGLNGSVISTLSDFSPQFIINFQEIPRFPQDGSEVNMNWFPKVMI